MNLDKVNKWLTLVANIGVIAGIVFLAVEIRQNTETQRLSAAQQVLGLSYSNWTVQATDGTFARLSLKVSKGEKLTPSETIDYDLMLRSLFIGIWQVHYQYESGFLDHEIYDAYDRRLEGIFQNQYNRDRWLATRYAYGENFQKWVNAIMERASTN